MRRLAMAGDVPGVDMAAAKAFLGWLGGLATATVGALGLWLAQRVLGKAAFQTAINDGFAKLTAELQEERDQLKRELAAEHDRIQAERVTWATDRASMLGEIRNLKQLVQSLKALLRKHGVAIPGDPEVETDPLAGVVTLQGGERGE
ncbi:hypothetical protein [Phenylobacterium sp.]|uniref:hypothetical protein n=1 Tax=Phenylobacterium sp. TaxID=1871053 RepID=UPI0025CC7834|nr:hypothetical protein [Phenylobacterium sp.]MBX3482555.1 hypothetical protein [Phenylobacterium sp.]